MIEFCQTTKVECFAKIVDGFKKITFQEELHPRDI